MSAVSAVKIFMEGGGRGNRRDLRRGMAAFLRPLTEAARKKSLRFNVVPCGSREEAYDRFRNDVGGAGPGQVSILLVDAEESVKRPSHVRAHLLETDGWDLREARGETIHLMAQIMETWIVADPKALSAYYGDGFNAAKLPKRTNLEEEPKGQVLNALKQATKRTTKGAYHNINHAGVVLQRLDPARVQARCYHCKRLFEELDRIIATA